MKASDWISVKDIFRIVSEEFSVTIEDMLSKSRERKLSDARKKLCYLLREKGYSHKHIGELLNRDRTTAIYLVNQYENEQYVHSLKIKFK